MASCEMCGKITSNLYKVKIAGSTMNVCPNCSNLGQKQEEKETSFSFYKKNKNKSIDYVLVDNYISLINSTLSKRNLTVHHLARALNIKESTLHKVLTNKFNLEIDLARKIENFLEIKLVIENDISSSQMNLEDLNSEKEEVSSLGDLIKKQLKDLKNKK